MNNERLKNLESFLEQDPKDPFNWYAVAMEYKAIDISKTNTYLNHLLENFPTYLAAYYQAAELRIDASKKAEAQSILEKGILLAKAQIDTNTLRELQNLLNNLLFDDE